MKYSNDYEVVLDGGSNVAVVPLGTEPDPRGYAWLYNRIDGTWGGRRLIGSIIAHGNGWVQPSEKTVLRIPGAPPSDDFVPARSIER